MKMAGFLSRISGLDRTVVWRHLQHLGAGEEAPFLKMPYNNGGRPSKVIESLIPITPLPDRLPAEGFAPMDDELFSRSDGEESERTSMSSSGSGQNSDDDLCPGLDFGL